MAPWQTGHENNGDSDGGDTVSDWPNRLLPVDNGDGGDAGCAPEKLKEKAF
jgi:hypothetical protein